MKNILILLMAVLLLNSSCSKEDVQVPETNNLLAAVKGYLKDSLAQQDFNELSFSKINVCNYNNGLQTVVVPFRYDSIESRHFVALRIEKGGHVSTGKIISFSIHSYTENLVIAQMNRLPSGQISISSLNRIEDFFSPIKDGYIVKFHPDLPQNINGSSQSFTDPYQNLPEVVVVSYSPSSSGYSGSWMNLLSMLGISSSINSYYQSVENYPGDYGGGGGGGGGYISTIPMLVDFEEDYNKEGIDVEKYLKCFDAIPDAGSLTSITMLTDIPVDNDPNVFFDWANGSPGHTFIRLNKSNGSQHVQQIIGFYPKNGWKTAFIPDPIESKFVDNAQHEFNASIRMTISAQDFRTTLNRLKYLAGGAKYDIDEFNCTDLALDLFNQSRGGNPLTIPLANIPGGAAGIESNTPQGLYQKLKTMKEQGDPAASNINMPSGKAFEGSSNGPCN